MAAFKTYLRKNYSHECLINDEMCSEKIIQAHTIQNKIILDQLAFNGHVYMIQDSLSERIKYKLVGKNYATTFTGFCSYHDNNLFEIIDLNPNDNLNEFTKERIVKFFLRNLSIELWKKLAVSKAYEKLILLIENKEKEKIEKILAIDWQQSIHIKDEVLKPWIIGTNPAIRTLRLYFNSCLQQIKRKKYHQTISYIEILPYNSPLAVSSVFTPLYDFSDQEIYDINSLGNNLDISLTIFPFKGKTYILFVTHRKNNNSFEKLMKQFSTMTESKKLITLSKIVILNCENTVFNPTFFDSLSPNQKNIIKQNFTDTILDVSPYSSYPDLNLFKNL